VEVGIRGGGIRGREGEGEGISKVGGGMEVEMTGSLRESSASVDREYILMRYDGRRRKERDNSSVTIWPVSPRAPPRFVHSSPSSTPTDSACIPRAASPSGKKSSSSKKHKSSKSSRRRHDSVSTDSETDSEEEERRRSKKHKSSSSKHRSSHRSSKSSRRPEEEEKAVVRVEKPREKVVEEDEEDMWEEKPSELFVPDDGDEEVGPMPVYVPGQKGGRNAYVFLSSSSHTN
jgi:hypothetical protein